MKKGRLAEDHSRPMRMGGHASIRRGVKRAIGAVVGASILTAAYHRLKNGTLYHDLGANHFDNRAEEHILQLVNRIKNLGFAVQITPMAA